MAMGIPAALAQESLRAAAGAVAAYRLNGAADRTFDAPIRSVEQAVFTTLQEMGFQVKAITLSEEGKLLRAAGNERDIEVRLVFLTSESTRIQAAVYRSFFVDRATSADLIRQTEKTLDGSFSGRSGP